MNGLTREEELVDAARKRMKWLPRAHDFQKATLPHFQAVSHPDIGQEVALAGHECGQLIFHAGPARPS